MPAFAPGDNEDDGEACDDEDEATGALACAVVLKGSKTLEV